MAVCLEDGKHPRGWFRSTHLNSVASNTRERAMKTFAPHTANRIRVRLTVCFVQGCRSWGWAAPGPQSQRGGVNVLCFSVSLVGESCVPECQPAMYLSREHRRCETCPAGTGTAFIPSISLQKKPNLCTSHTGAHNTQDHPGCSRRGAIPKQGREITAQGGCGLHYFPAAILLNNHVHREMPGGAPGTECSCTQCRCWAVFLLERLVRSFYILIRAILYFLIRPNPGAVV